MKAVSLRCVGGGPASFVQYCGPAKVTKPATRFLAGFRRGLGSVNLGRLNGPDPAISACSEPRPDGRIVPWPRRSERDGNRRVGWAAGRRRPRKGKRLHRPYVRLADAPACVVYTGTRLGWAGCHSLGVHAGAGLSDQALAPGNG